MSCTSKRKLEGRGSLPSRKELQSYLKRHGIGAVGSTDALRAACEAHQSGLATSEVTASLVDRSVSSPNKKKPASNKPSPEKRIKPFRKKCSQQTRARIDRAKTQRLYLVRRGNVSDDLECEFVVLGSTGNVYTVKIAKLPFCTCPDSQKGHHCKHILFVLMKVIGIDSDSPLLYQAALISSELEQIFRCMENRRVGGGTNAVMANEQVRASYAASLKGECDTTTNDDESGKDKRKTLDQDADCPICFDSLASGTLTFCRSTCGTNFHEDCIRRWLGQHRTDPTCPNCRQPWQSTDGAPGSATKEGYANFGQLQGQSQQRDTSTYSQWSPYSYGYKRRRYW